MVVADSLPPPAVTARAKHLARKPALEARARERLIAEQRMATTLSAVMAVNGVTNVQLAEWLGVVETVVRDIKGRKKPLSAYHLMQLPPDFREALLRAWTLLFQAPVANDNADETAP